MRVNVTLARGLVVLGCAAVALVLGYVGLRTFVTQPAAKPLMLGHSWADILYTDLQLFVLQAPVNGPGPFPLPLQIARFLAPATTILAGVETLRVLLAEQLRTWSALSASRHAIVTGDSPAALELSRRLRAEYRKVVLVCATEAAAPRRGCTGCWTFPVT